MVILDVVELMRLVMCVHAEKLTFVVPKRHYGKDVLLVLSLVKTVRSNISG